MPKEEKEDNSFGVASVVLGIVGLVASVVVLPVVISITALVFGIVQYKKAKNNWAIWGIVLSALGIIIAVLVVCKLYLMSVQFRDMVNQCAANPSAPGCASIAQLLGGTA